MARFPSDEWVTEYAQKLNENKNYEEAARTWEGDFLFVVTPDEGLDREYVVYLDLWHGKCRDAYIVEEGKQVKSAFTLRGPYENYVRLLAGELDPMQALLTRKLSVQGNMAVLMRNVPTVLDFVRCCKEITDSFV